MPAALLTPKEKKLRNLRKILWIIFAAVAITILLVGGLSLPAAWLINRTTNFMALFANETGLVLLSLLTVALVKIALAGVVCLVIYAIFKYRLDRDDDLFL